jgi:hypothetical protein
LPFYVARLDGQRTRYIVLSPVSLRRSKSAVQFVSGLVGGLSLPAETLSARYEQLFARALGAALEGTGGADASAAGAAAAVTGGAPGADVLADPELKPVAMQGLEILKQDNWLRGKQYEEQREAVAKMFR